MLRRLGYACLSLSVAETSPRGTILRNATPERLRALIAANLAGLKRVLEFNVECGVRMFRLSSDIVPFGSHPVNTISWWDEFAEPLAEIGTLIRHTGMRVSMHPGQYTVLSSPDQRIVDAARADLAFHARLLDALGLNTRHKIVIHVGGAYSDKAAALDRWSAAFLQLPQHVRARLVLENDERLFGADLDQPRAHLLRRLHEAFRGDASRAERIHLSANAFAFGARYGVWMTSIPSPAKKVPKEVSMMPTTYLRVFSGTWVSGRLATTPTATTAITEAAAPRTGER